MRSIVRHHQRDALHSRDWRISLRITVGRQRSILPANSPVTGNADSGTTTPWPQLHSMMFSANAYHERKKIILHIKADVSQSDLPSEERESITQGRAKQKNKSRTSKNVRCEIIQKAFASLNPQGRCVFQKGRVADIARNPLRLSRVPVVIVRFSFSVVVTLSALMTAATPIVVVRSRVGLMAYLTVLLMCRSAVTALLPVIPSTT